MPILRNQQLNPVNILKIMIRNCKMYLRRCDPVWGCRKIGLLCNEICGVCVQWERTAAFIIQTEYLNAEGKIDDDVMPK